MKPERVVAVMVTWNRRTLLVEALQAVLSQTSAPSHVVVVDNASDDGTGQVLRDQFPGLDVTTATSNLGGAGGFALGVQHALRQPCDALWLMDDDTIAQPNALAELLRARHAYQGTPAVVASKVVWTDGRDHPMNTPRVKPGVRAAERDAARSAGCVPIRSASFVSVLVDAGVARQRGLPIADYFLWNDDFEFTARLLRGRRGLYCPTSVVVHKTAVFGSTDADPGERFFYEVRNKVWLFSRSRALSPVEKVLYGVATLRRWFHTAAASTDRRTLLNAARRGVGAGLRSGPRPTAEILAAGTRPTEADPGRNTGGPVNLSRVEDEPFSLLMSVWSGDNPSFVEAAFRSVVHDQTRRPDEVVLVQDGPVGEELAAMLTSLVESSPVQTTVLALAANVGLGVALDQGMAACAHDIIARMDADDIAVPERFAIQVPVIEAGADLVGSSLLEFGAGVEDIVGKRVPPLDPAEIVRYARFHQPFNHPTVVYRRRAVEAAGGYRHLALMEDYLLFAKMIRQGARVANVAEPLVLYRVGAGAYARRGGVALLKSEWRLQRQLRRIGFTTRAEFVRNVVVRGAYRLAPEDIRRITYRLVVARKGER